MQYETSWNKLVSQYNKNLDKKEDIVQASWELLLSTVFDYPDTDIYPQEQVQMGRAKNRPDIIVRHGDDDLFVMELKRHVLHEGQEQLFSYLNQLKIDTGVLVCDKLYVYDFDYTKKADNYSYVEIDFTQDNPDGIKFVELFTSGNFDRQKIKDFIAQKNQSKKNLTLIRKDLTDDFVLSAVKNHLTEKYPAEDVESVLSEMVITVRPKTAVTPATVVAGAFVPKANVAPPEVDYRIGERVVDAKEFKEKLLQTKHAQRTWYYANGNTVQDPWEASNFTRESSLSSNVHSTNKYKAWKKTGLVKVVICIKE